jgi:hypothetical protein
MNMETLTLSELTESPSQQVWVLNVSEQISPNGDKSEVYIIVRYNDEHVSLHLPKTWLPINLSDRLPKKALVESANFLNSLHKGLIVPVTPEYAAEINGREGADEERRRLKELEEAVKAASRAKDINVEISGMKRDTLSSNSRGTIDVTNVSLSDNTIPAEAVTEEVSANFKALVKRLNSIPMTEAVNELKLRGSLNKVYARYLYENIKHEPIRKHLAKALAA